MRSRSVIDHRKLSRMGLMLAGVVNRQTPWEIVNRDHPDIKPEILALPPVLLETEFERTHGVGQDVPWLDGLRIPST
jgi:hypothetical protein